jgi:hypothetical protein
VNNIKNLIRDAEKIHANLRESSDGKLITLVDCKIYIPVRFSERGLVSIEAETHIVGIYAIVMEDTYYGVSMVNAMIRIDPNGRNIVSIDGEDYFEFLFEAGSAVMASVNLVKSDILVYRIYDELISKGKIPWYLQYTDLAKLFETAIYHAGANIGRDHEVTELLVSMISRNPDNRVEYYRQVVKQESDLKTIKPAFIPLKSVTYSATNTTNKLAGSFFSEGVVSALVSPSLREERIESLLRT